MDEQGPEPAQVEKLLAQMRLGIEGAFDELFEFHRPYLLRFLSQHLEPRLQSRFDESDIVQETYCEARRRLADFLQRGEPMPFRLWLRQTAYERLLMHRRRHLGAARRSVQREQGLPDQSSFVLAQQLWTPGSSPSQRVVREELAGQIQKAMAKLDELDRQVLVLRACEDLSYEEVAYLLKIKSAAARQRYGRALVKLQTLLAENGVDESRS